MIDSGDTSIQRHAFVVQPNDGHCSAPVGDPIRTLVDSLASAGHCGVYELTTTIGRGPPLHRHRHEDEYFYILEGEIRFVSDGREFTAGPGRFVALPRGTVHSFVNDHAAPARAILIVTPPKIEQMFEDLTAAGKDATPEDFAAICARYDIEILGPPLGPRQVPPAG